VRPHPTYDPCDTVDELEDVLQDQLRYYRARAAEYDEWWDRRGRYDRGVQANERWFGERAVVEAAFDALDLRGAVLELAAGTGIWTKRLVERAESVTVVDGSPEMIELNRRRLGRSSSRVRYVLADLFAWRPGRRFDAVVFCFWLSHVPLERFDRFVATVAEALPAEGRLFFLDGRREPTSTAVDHSLPTADEQVMRRRLNDGSTYSVVKNFWSSNDLERRFATVGVELTVSETPMYFQYGIGERVRSGRTGSSV
jgi:SAM-dependent methyltransferase